MRRRDFIRRSVGALAIALVPAIARGTTRDPNRADIVAQPFVDLPEPSGWPELAFESGATINGLIIDGVAQLATEITLVSGELLQIKIAGSTYEVWFVQNGLQGCLRYTDERGWQNCYNTQIPQLIQPHPLNTGADRFARVRTLYTRGRR